MERLRLPDRYGEPVREEAGASSGGSSKKRGAGSKLGFYGPLLLLFVVLFVFMADEDVPLHQMTVNDVTVLEGHESEGIFIAGILDEDAGKFSKAEVQYDAASGIAEVCIHRYQFSFLFGTKEFVAQIKEKPESVKEIWLVCHGTDGTADKMQLEWGSAA